MVESLLRFHRDYTCMLTQRRSERNKGAPLSATETKKKKEERTERITTRIAVVVAFGGVVKG